MTISPFESELAAFDHDSAPHHAAVFYGSSSIRMWENLAQSFAGIPVANRGFGGSTLAECVAVLARVVFPLDPAALVLYAADNDLDQGASPEHVEWLFGQFIAQLRERFPALPVAYVSVKPSPARFWNVAKISRANELVRNTASRHSGVAYVDVYGLMLNSSGGPRPELYNEDGLHLNAAGYALWTGQIRPWLDAQPAVGQENHA